MTLFYKGAVIDLTDGIIEIPLYVTKLRFELHGGRGGRGGDGYVSGSSGQNGGRVAGILDYSKGDFPRRFQIKVGRDGGNTAIYYGDQLYLQASGGKGGNGGRSTYINSVPIGGFGGSGGSGYINGSKGSNASGQGTGGGSGGAGGGIDYVNTDIFEVDTNYSAYTSGLVRLTVLDTLNARVLIKSRDRILLYNNNNEWVDTQLTEPLTQQDFEEYGISDLSFLTQSATKYIKTMELEREEGDEKIYKATIDASKFDYIEKIRLMFGR